MDHPACQVYTSDKEAAYTGTALADVLGIAGMLKEASCVISYLTTSLK